MRQRGYLIAFVLVLLAAGVGGFIGGRFLIRRLQQDFGSQATWAPPTVAASAQTEGATPEAAANVRSTSSLSRNTPSVLATPIPTRILVTVPAPAGAETPASDAASPEPDSDSDRD